MGICANSSISAASPVSAVVFRSGIEIVHTVRQFTKSEQKTKSFAIPTVFPVSCAAISERIRRGGDGFSVPSVILIAASLEV
jgi:hypothetical protein